MAKNKKLFLLTRDISAYSGEDLFLGVYDNLALANNQKEAYVRQCKIKDDWKEQAYRDVNLEKDVEVIEIQDKQTEEMFPKEGQNIYLVSGIAEGFGQIVKELVFISIDEVKVKNFIQIKFEEDHNEDDQYADYKDEVLVLNAPVVI